MVEEIIKQEMQRAKLVEYNASTDNHAKETVLVTELRYEDLHYKPFTLKLERHKKDYSIKIQLPYSYKTRMLLPFYTSSLNQVRKDWKISKTPKIKHYIIRNITPMETKNILKAHQKGLKKIRSLKNRFDHTFIKHNHFLN